MGTDRNNFLVQCSTAWLESVCFIILAKEIINAKIAKKRKMIKFNCLFLSWDIGAGGKGQVPPPPFFWEISCIHFETLYVSEIERVKGNPTKDKDVTSGAPEG
jgi:hypothetical protein